MNQLADEIDRIAAETSFSGAVQVDRDGIVEFARAYGSADRRNSVANTVGTQFGIASGTKGLTAMAVVSLIENGVFGLATTARSLLGDDLALIADDVTIEQLLGHRSGIGDYVDEDAGHEITDHILPVSVHELATTAQYLRVLDGFVAKSEPDELFCYNNGGYVVLALLAERATGTSFHELVAQRVCEPAGMSDTAFLRSDELPGNVAVGYLAADGLRTNVFHLPVRGSGDGGIYSTAADVHALWTAFFAGRIVSPYWVGEMVRPRSNAPSDSMRYGLGFWLDESGDAVTLIGGDAGVSFRTVHDPGRQITHTVLSNWSEGAWPITRRLGELLNR